VHVDGVLSNVDALLEGAHVGGGVHHVGGVLDSNVVLSNEGCSEGGHLGLDRHGLRLHSAGVGVLDIGGLLNGVGLVLDVLDDLPGGRDVLHSIDRDGGVHVRDRSLRDIAFRFQSPHLTANWP